MVRLGFNLARVLKKTGKERERRLRGGSIVGSDLLEGVGLGEGGIDWAARTASCTGRALPRGRGRC
jgi:hypothetical protein